MQAMLVAKALRRIRKNKDKAGLSCYGLLLNKEVGGYLVEMDNHVSDPAAVGVQPQLRVMCYNIGALTPSTLCFRSKLWSAKDSKIILLFLYVGSWNFTV